MSSQELLVLDLETITDRRLPLPERKRCPGNGPGSHTELIDGRDIWVENPCTHFVGGCPKCGTAPDVFLPPSYHQIVAIGYARVVDYRITDLDVLGKSELVGLQTITSHLDTVSPRLIGWNSRGFDAPVLAARCLALGIPFPWYYRGARNADPRYRYSDSAHYDVKDVLGDYGAGRSASLDAVAKSIGLPGKVGVDGSMVAGLVTEGRIEEMLSYCACDVAQTFGVMLRMELVRGRLDVPAYRAAAKDLVRVITEHPRLAALRGGIDCARLFLEDV